MNQFIGFRVSFYEDETASNDYCLLEGISD